MGNKILLVDDDEQLRNSFYNLLSAEGYTVRAAASGEMALQLCAEELPDVVIMDVRMSGLDGLATLKLLKQKEPRLPVIIMTAYSTTEAAIEATKLGAFDYILKPFEIPDVLELLSKAMEASRVMRGRVVFKEAEATSPETEVLVGKSQAMHQVYKAIGRVAETDALVLLRGESGTGKELVARAIYQHSLRSKLPLTVVNSVAIPETLLESELFGYERGAFTGAVAKRIGKIEQANGGTLFLDEIGDMPLSVQGKILRLLQEKKIERLGGNDLISVDARIIAATNRDLEAAVAGGNFREDLFYRLNVVVLHLPPLRERKDDIPLLLKHFSSVFCSEMDIPVPNITPQAVAAFIAYPWPGNVRELRNTLQKLLIFNRGNPISADDVKLALDSPNSLAVEHAHVSPSLPKDFVEHVRNYLGKGVGERVFEDLMDEAGSLVIREALQMCRGNRSRTAKMLGLSRPTLLAKIDKYKI